MFRFFKECIDFELKMREKSAQAEGLILGVNLIRIKCGGRSGRIGAELFSLICSTDNLGEHPAHAIRVDVDAVWEGLLELILEVGRPIIDAPVDPEIFYHPVAPVLATAKSNDIAASSLRELSNDGAD